MKLIQYLHIHPRLIIISFRKSPADNLHQIGISRIILRQKYQVVISVLPAGQFLVKTGIRRHIYLAAHDGIDARCLRFFIKFDHAIHHPVVCNGCAVHAQFLYSFHIFLNLIGTVQKTVFRMHVQMRKCHKRYLLFFLCTLPPGPGLHTSD